MEAEKKKKKSLESVDIPLGSIVPPTRRVQLRAGTGSAYLCRDAIPSIFPSPLVPRHEAPV